MYKPGTPESQRTVDGAMDRFRRLMQGANDRFIGGVYKGGDIQTLVERLGSDANHAAHDYLQSILKLET
jgi:hypothetical protein